MTKLQVCVQQVYLQALFQTLQTTKVNFEKTVGQTSFQKQPLQSVSIFFKICPSVP